MSDAAMETSTSRITLVNRGWVAQVDVSLVVKQWRSKFPGRGISALRRAATLYSVNEIHQ